MLIKIQTIKSGKNFTHLQSETDPIIADNEAIKLLLVNCKRHMRCACILLNQLQTVGAVFIYEALLGPPA